MNKHAVAEGKRVPKPIQLVLACICFVKGMSTTIYSLAEQDIALFAYQS